MDCIEFKIYDYLIEDENMLLKLSLWMNEKDNILPSSQ